MKGLISLTLGVTFFLSLSAGAAAERCGLLLSGLESLVSMLPPENFREMKLQDAPDQLADWNFIAAGDLADRSPLLSPSGGNFLFQHVGSDRPGIFDPDRNEPIPLREIRGTEMGTRNSGPLPLPVFSADGQWLAYIVHYERQQGTRLALYHLEERGAGRGVRASFWLNTPFGREREYPVAVQFIPDSQEIAVLTHLNRVLFFHRKTLRRTRTWRFPPTWNPEMNFVPSDFGLWAGSDSLAFVSPTEEAPARLHWLELQTGARLATVSVPVGRRPVVAISPDGQSLASFGQNELIVVGRDGRVKFQRQLSAEITRTPSLQWSPFDGSLAVGCTQMLEPSGHRLRFTVLAPGGALKTELAITHHPADPGAALPFAAVPVQGGGWSLFVARPMGEGRVTHSQVQNYYLNAGELEAGAEYGPLPWIQRMQFDASRSHLLVSLADPHVLLGEKDERLIGNLFWLQLAGQERTNPPIIMAQPDFPSGRRIIISPFILAN